jgi:hypothetical protein
MGLIAGGRETSGYELLWIGPDIPATVRKAAIRRNLR